MTRTLLSLVALTALLVGQPPAASAAQATQRKSAARSPQSRLSSEASTSTPRPQRTSRVCRASVRRRPQRIVDYRQKNGPFKKIEELMNVRGVGEKNFLKLKAQISVAAAKADHESPLS